MHRDVVCLRMGDSLASVLVHPAWLEFHTLPVLDEKDLFAGPLRYKTLRRLANQVDSRPPPRSSRYGLGRTLSHRSVGAGQKRPWGRPPQTALC